MFYNPKHGMPMRRVKLERENGFILIILLIILQFVSAVGLYTLFFHSRLLKSQYEAWQRVSNLLVIKRQLQVIENKLISVGLPCLQESMSSIKMAKQPLLWWQENGCSANSNEIRYYYAVESLGKDACHVIRLSDRSFATEFFRITLLALTLQNEKFILQSTVAKPVDAILPCTEKLHPVTLGRQMWREI